MNGITYVGLDVHKATVCVAIAESARTRARGRAIKPLAPLAPRGSARAGANSMYGRSPLCCAHARASLKSPKK